MLVIQGSNPALCEEKKLGKHLGVMTWVWPGPLTVSEGKGRNTCHEAGFFSEDSAVWLLGEFLHTEHDMSIDFRE